MLRIPPLSCAFLPLLAGLAHSQTIPAGWRAVSAASSWDSPGVTCANHELTPWRVDVDSARSVLTIQPGSERPHTDSVPFQGGMLAGFDHGEFGGSVEWHGAGTVEKIGDENPVVFIRGSHAVYLLAGLAHMGSNEGRLLRITKTGAAWKIETLLQLGFAPTALFPLGEDSILVAGHGAVANIRPPDELHILHRNKVWIILDPASVARSASGTIYVGMRGLVARLKPSGSAYTEDWLVPERSKCF